MHQICLHLYSPDIATRYVQTVRGEVAPEWSWWPDELPRLLDQEITETEANRLTSGIVLAMADALPTFHQDGVSLTQWEALVDRGVGMYMRPPARIFVDRKVNPYLIDKMPIRLDLHGGPPMGGAWIPSHLVANVHRLIEERLEPWAKRIHEAELDPYPLLATLHMATESAMQQNLGLIESMDVLPPDARVVQTPNRKQMDPNLRTRIELALKEEKHGLFDRWFNKS